MTVFEALAEPRRRAILDALRDGERCVGDLVATLDAPQPTVSKHLRVLRDAGLVTSRVDAQRRLYRLDVGPLREVDDWVAPYRGLWTHALDQLEAHLDQMAKGGSRGRRARTSR